jgi:hypothetical protein
LCWVEFYVITGNYFLTDEKRPFQLPNYTDTTITTATSITAPLVAVKPSGQTNLHSSIFKSHDGK